jgi:hypothetical protein
MGIARACRQINRCGVGVALCCLCAGSRVHSKVDEAYGLSNLFSAALVVLLFRSKRFIYIFFIAAQKR